MTDTEKRAAEAASVGKGPRTRKPRRRRRMLTGVSRQRRAANARERRRIQGVNNAFVELKSKIPVEQPDDVSKIETLRLAAKWIAHLTTVLIQDDKQKGSCSKQTMPKTLQDKLQDLLQFELEDFMLISDSLSIDSLRSDSLRSDSLSANSLSINCLSTNSLSISNPSTNSDKQNYCNESKSNQSNLNVPSNFYSNSYTQCDSSNAVYDGWGKACSSGDISSSSSSSSSGSSSPSALQYLESCDAHCLADDALGLGHYDLDLPPLASVFSQQPTRNHWTYFGGQYDVPQAVPTGFYR